MMTGKHGQTTRLGDVVSIPRADVVETNERFLLLMDLPGVPKEKITIRVNDGVLSVIGIPERESLQGKRMLHGEVTHTAFQRSFMLSEDIVDMEHLSAHLEHGVLSMTLPKRHNRRARRIPVRRVQ